MSEEIEGPKILGVLYILSALQLIIVYAFGLGWAIVYNPTFLTFAWFVYLAAFVAVPICIGLGLAKIKTWGWFAGIGHNLIAIVAAALGFLPSLSAIWAAVVTVYLLTPRVRDAFNISEPSFLSQ